MPDHDDHGGGWHGPPWMGGRPPWSDGPPPWANGRGGVGPGHGFRRGAFLFFGFVVLLVAALASLVAAVVGGRAPHLWISAPLAALVIAGLIVSARWVWRNTRAVGALMDAADRVAGGDHAARVEPAGSGQLRRLGGAFNQMTDRLGTNEARRRELLADVAHELRTPLQVIRGSVEGMLDGLYATDPSRLRALLDETSIMARLLEDLRTLSMADEGVLPLHREPVDPRGLVEDAARSFAGAARDRDVTLAVAADGAPTSLEVDPVRVTEVLTNLVSNAIRHTPRGGRVAIALAADPAGGAAFTVTDTGPGIPDDDLPRIFDRFVRSADTGGTGLGLAIAKRLVEAHRGTIEATRPPEGGTRITFTIPG